MLVPDSKLAAPDRLCRKQLLFRGTGGGKGGEERIYHWNNSIIDLLLKMLSLVLLQRTETEGQGGGWREQGMHSVDLLML